MITGVLAWEAVTWLPAGDVPDWMVPLKRRHGEAVAEYEAAIAGVVNMNAAVEAEARHGGVSFGMRWPQARSRQRERAVT